MGQPNGQSTTPPASGDGPRQRIWVGPLVLALGYVLFGVVYIEVSGEVVARAARAVEDLAALERTKGILFMVVNGGGLFGAAYLYRRRLERTRVALERERERVSDFEHYLGGLYSGLPCALLVVDVVGPDALVVERTNPALARMLGLPQSALEVGQHEPLRTALGPERWQALTESIRQCVESGQPVEREVTRRDGAQLESLLQQVVPLTHRSGGVGRVFVTLTDISALRASEQRLSELESQLRHSQRLLTVGEISAGVAHDVNNLLTVIATHADLLRRVLAGRSELEHSIAVIERAVEQAAGISRSLLGFSRSLRSTPRRIQLAPLVQDIAQLLGRSLPRQLELRVDLAGLGSAAVDGDRIQLQQVLMNLVLNARDAMPKGGVIRLHGERRGDELWLHVDDEGGGMAPKVAAQVFDPFFTTKGENGGSGLGLPIARRIAREHGGEIHLGARPSGGTRASLRLPLAVGQTEEAQRAPQPDQWLLLMEAQPQVRGILAGELADMGYRVELADEADDALACMELEARPPALLILDQPDLDRSLRTLRALRQGGSDAPCLLMSLEQPKATALEVEPLHVLRKPFGVADFGRAVRNALVQAPVEG